MHALPASGAMTLGRGRQAAICIDEPSLSRAHARLHIGPALRIEDLGSVNGTRVAGRMLMPHAPHPIAIGEPVELGAVTLLVLRSAAAEAAPPTSLVVRDPVMIELHQRAQRVAAGNISVLLLGETGTGKEILAEAVHRHSARHKRPLLRLNCAAFAESLLESELFGHEKGAFSGAVQAKPGLLETAEGGTIFLDELGDMPPALQAKLLRVLEERKVTRVGGLKARAIDVRFIAATHRDLGAEATSGRFRSDLFYRLAGVSLVLPPLRQRTLEIVPLAELFVARFAAEIARPASRLTAAARAELERYPWPGNIRELRNVIERAVLLSAGDEIPPENLALEAPRRVLTHEAEPTHPIVTGDDEKSRIVAALEQCAGNQTHAARLLGISRGTLVSRLAEYAIPRPRKRPR
jgi:DNA-binding NtrC family response regulator